MNDLIDLDKSFYMNTFGDRFPLCFTSGNECTLTSTTGKKYVDFGSGIGVNALGYNHPSLVETISHQAAKLMHCSSLYYIKEQSELAKTLVDNSFADKAFFCNSGTEAVEAAIKLARKLGNGKFHIVSTTNSFHGRTLGALAATGQEKYQQPFAPMVNGFSYVEYNNLVAIEQAITSETCAVLVEPIQGEGGVLPATSAYLSDLRKLCDKHNVLLIFDEIQTGIGRTGTLFAYEHYNVCPDIIALAKGLGGGIPIGAILATDHVASAFAPGNHGTTFGGNPLCCATAQTVLNTLLADNFLETVKEKAVYLMNSLEQSLAPFDVVLDIRGKGLMVGIQLSNDVPAINVVKAMIEKGFLLLTAGHNTVRLLPPLIIKKEEIDAMIVALVDVLNAN